MTTAQSRQNFKSNFLIWSARSATSETAYMYALSSELDCQLWLSSKIIGVLTHTSTQSTLQELEEQIKRTSTALSRDQELSAHLRRQIDELKLAHTSGSKDRDERRFSYCSRLCVLVSLRFFLVSVLCTHALHCYVTLSQLRHATIRTRQREQQVHQEHKEKMEQQRQTYMLEHEKLRRSHSQAAEVLQLKIQSLEKRLEDGVDYPVLHTHARTKAPHANKRTRACVNIFDFVFVVVVCCECRLMFLRPCIKCLENITERAESARQIEDIEERLREYEEALDELEKDHEEKLRSAAQDARR